MLVSHDLPYELLRESEMKRFMLLHFGFEKPTAEIMAAWGKWFDSVADKSVDNGGFHGGAREISHSGSKDLPMGMESITGFSIINAESLEDAKKSLRTIHSLRASGFTKSWKCRSIQFVIRSMHCRSGIHRT